MYVAGFQYVRGGWYGMHLLLIAWNWIDVERSSFVKPGIVPTGSDFFYAGLDPEFVQRDPMLRPFSFYTYWPDMQGRYGNVRAQSSPTIPLVGGAWQEVVFHV